MKGSFVKEIEASENVVALLAKRKDIVEAVHDTFLSSEDIEVVERLCVALSDLYRGDERGRKLQRNGETPNNNSSHSPGRTGGTGTAAVMAPNPISGSEKELLINRRCLCLQFLPAILIRYLSLLVSQTSKEEMVLSLIEAFLVVICTSSTKKLSSSSKSASVNELDLIGDNFVIVPNLLKPSVYMYNNEVLFAKDFISYPASRVEIVKLRSEPSISKLDSSNRNLTRKRQEVLTFSISQYNSYLSQFDLTSQKHFCHMCSCFVMSGFDLSKTKLTSLSSRGRGGEEKRMKQFLNKRFVLSQSLMIEMLQGLYQLSFLLSLRDDCVSAVEHIAFRAKHSLMPQVIMLTDSVRKAIERSVLKQDDTILSSPEVSFQDRVKAVTSDSLRITARRESIRLESANYYNTTFSNTGGAATATSSAAETENNAKGHKHDVKGIHAHSQQLRPSAAVQELEYYKLGSETYLTKRHQHTTTATPVLPPHYPNPPTSLHLDLTSSEGARYGSNNCDTSNGPALTASRHTAPPPEELCNSKVRDNSPRHSFSGTPTPKEKSSSRGKEGASNQGSIALVTHFKSQQNMPSENTSAHHFSSKGRGAVSKSGDSSNGGRKGSLFSKQGDSSDFCNNRLSESCADQSFSSGGGAKENNKNSKTQSSSRSSNRKSAKYTIEDDDDSDRTLIEEYSGLMSSINSNNSGLANSFNSTTNCEFINSSGGKPKATLGFKVSRDGTDESSTITTSEVRSIVRSSIAAELSSESTSRSSASAPLAVVTEL